MIDFDSFQIIMMIMMEPKGDIKCENFANMKGGILKILDKILI